MKSIHVFYPFFWPIQTILHCRHSVKLFSLLTFGETWVVILARFNSKFNHPHLLTPFHSTSFWLISTSFLATSTPYNYLRSYALTYQHKYIHGYIHAYVHTYIIYIYTYTRKCRCKVTEVLPNEGLYSPSLGRFTKCL